MTKILLTEGNSFEKRIVQITCQVYKKSNAIFTKSVKERSLNKMECCWASLKLVWFDGLHENIIIVNVQILTTVLDSRQF